MAQENGRVNVRIVQNGRVIKLGSNNQQCLEAAAAILAADTNLHVGKVQSVKIEDADGQGDAEAKERFRCHIEAQTPVNAATYSSEVEQKITQGLTQQKLQCRVRVQVQS